MCVHTLLIVSCKFILHCNVAGGKWKVVDLNAGILYVRLCIGFV